MRRNGYSRKEKGLEQRYDRVVNNVFHVRTPYCTLNALVVFAIIIKNRGKGGMHSNFEGMVEISDQIVSGELKTCCRT